jgi:tetratricopeptide (TPR) repeat protein
MGILATELADKINSFTNFFTYFPSDDYSSGEYLLYQCEILTLLIVALEKNDSKSQLIEIYLNNLHDKLSNFYGKKDQIKVYNVLSVTHAKESPNISKNLIDKAFTILNDAENQDSKDFLLEAVTYHNHGSILNVTGSFNQSKENSQKSITILEENSSNKYANLILSDSYYNMGYSLANLNLFNEAEEYFQKSLDKANEYCKLRMSS